MQRGLGRSYPNFSHRVCTASDFNFNDAGQPISQKGRFNEFSEITDVTNVDQIKAALRPYAKRAFDCWNCETCGFRFREQQPDGSFEDFHFLEYSGTRELAEDIDRMRELLQAPFMHVYGGSYGTQGTRNT